MRYQTQELIGLNRIPDLSNTIFLTKVFKKETRRKRKQVHIKKKVEKKICCELKET